MDLVKGYVVGSEYYEEVVYFENTAENIASFIVNNFMNKCIVTDLADTLIVNSMVGGYIDTCPNQEYLIKELHPAIIPMQLGEIEPKNIKFIERD